ADKKARSIHSDGIALGFDKGPVFERTLREIELELKPGDRIVLCTPGLFGIKDSGGNELGEGRFYQLVEREAGKASGAFVKLVSHCRRSPITPTSSSPTGAIASSRSRRRRGRRGAFESPTRSPSSTRCPQCTAPRSRRCAGNSLETTLEHGSSCGRFSPAATS